MLQTELDSVIVLLIETLQETVVHMSFLELTFRNSILSFLCHFSTYLIPLPWWRSSRSISDTIASLHPKFTDLFKITRKFVVGCDYCC